MSRNDNNQPSTQSSGAAAGSQTAEQPIVEWVPLDFGIDYTSTPNPKPRKENRVKFDFSGYETGPDGVLQKVTILSVKKKSDQEKAKESGCCGCVIA